jgi:hypothetical protein
VCGVHRRQRPSGACRRRAGGNGCTSGREASTVRAVGRLQPRELERAAAPRLGGGRTLRLKGPTAVLSEVAGERIRAIEEERV